MTLPSPPDRLPEEPETVLLEPGTPLVRIYDPERGPWHSHRFHGPLSNARFDHHPPSPGGSGVRSVWYTSLSLRGAVAEAFGRQGFVDRNGGRCVVKVRVVRSIRLLDLVGTAAKSVGLTQEIGTVTDYARTREWARAFYDGYRHVRGIRWRGREMGSINVVLHDRVDMAALEAELDEEIHHVSVWPRIARAARDCRLGVI